MPYKIFISWGTFIPATQGYLCSIDKRTVSTEIFDLVLVHTKAQ